jgi:PAS domain S-box-containing protein
MKTKVLIVDDNRDNLYLLKTILKGQGWDVCEAANGKVALEIARNQVPDLIVSDILMPVMDGYAFCRQCKTDEKLKKIPFVFYTATYTEPKDEKFALDLGADRFIVKPREPDVLLEILTDLLEEKKNISPDEAKPLGEEMEFFRRHNEILFSKLEKKMLDLETLNQELKVMEEQAQLSFENVSDVIFTMDMDLKILSMTPSVEKVLGYKVQDFVGRYASDLGSILTRQSLDQAINYVSGILKGETMPPSTYEFIAKDQTLRIGEVSGSPIMRDGKISGIVAVARDITESKRAEEELRRREQQFSLIINSFPGRIAQIGRDFRYQFINNQFENFHGMTSDQVLGHTVAEVFGEDIFQRLRPFIQKALDGEMVSTETRFETCKGKTIYGLNNYIPDKGPDGTIRGVFGVIFDITKIKEAEKALRKSEENFRNSMDQSILGVRIVSDDGTTLYANQALLNLYGFDSIEELKNIPVTKCYTKESLAENRIRREQRKRGESGPLNYVISIIAKDGKLRHLDVFRKEVIWDGVRRFQVLYNDITERRRAEEALRERDILFNKLSLNVPGVIYQFMKKPDGTYCVPFSSRAIVNIFGCSPEDVREDFSPVVRVTLPEDIDKLIKSIELSALQMTTWQCEYRVQLPGQPVKWLFGQATPEKLEDGSIIWHGYNTDITERKKEQEELQQTLDRLSKAMNTTIHLLAGAVEARDPYTAGHQTRAADLARAIATEMEIPREKIDGIGMAGSIHDIGKLSVPAEILTKSSKLTKVEFALVKEHAVKGYEMLKDVESSWPLAEMVYQHHERMDGSGYPRNLKGEEIIMEARILAVADVVEAMSSHRPYRPALGVEAALEEIGKNRGILYDNAVAEACLRLFREKGYRFPEITL